MNNALLICPWDRPAVPLLGANTSLACVPLLGQGLIEYWLSHLACLGTTHVLILADERPEQIRALIGNGERWGLHALVLDEQRELTPGEVLLKYETELNAAAPQHGITLIEHFPGQPEHRLFENYCDWFAALKAWLPRARTPDRVGVLEPAPGIQVGLHSRISAEARLHAPCWIGKNVYIGAGATIGPETIIEDGALIEPGATVTQSVVGKETFVGQLAQINGSFAWGDALINLETGSTVTIPDRFLLCGLRRSRSVEKERKPAPAPEIVTKAEEHLLWRHLLLNKES